MITIERFKTPFAIVPPTVLSTSPLIWTSTSFLQGQNFDITIEAIAGDMYITTKSTAPTSTNTFKLLEGDVLDLKVNDYLAMIGNSTTCFVQAIIWG